MSRQRLKDPRVSRVHRRASAPMLRKEDFLAACERLVKKGLIRDSGRTRDGEIIWVAIVPTMGALVPYRERKHLMSSILNSEDLARMGIKPDLSCDTTDPRNARYLVPLEDAGEEQNARGMADIIWSAAMEELDKLNDLSQAEADQFYEKYLIDARRMWCDQSYSDLFE